MKYLFLLLIIYSCATHKSKEKTVINKYEYLQNFYKLKDQLKLQNKLCTDYTRSTLILSITEVNNQFQLKEPGRLLAESFKPQVFDWQLRAKIHNLHLNYDFKEDIYREYLDISTNIKECLNDFTVLNFMRAIAFEADQNQKFKPIAKKILKAYISYISKDEMPILSVLITASIIGEFNKVGIVEIKNPNLFKSTSKSMNDLINIQSKAIKKFNKLANYKKLYDIYKIIRKTKTNYKAFLVSSFLYK